MKKLLQYSPEIVDKYSSATIVLDSAALIDASKVKEFGDLISRIADGGCKLYSTVDVYFEFMRGAKTLEEFINFKQFVDDLNIKFSENTAGSIYGIDGIMFNLAINNCFDRAKNLPSLTDVMLMLELFINREKDIFLMTANHKDIPAQIFDRTDLVAFETKNEIRTEAVYALNKDRLGKLFEKMLGRESS